jgi:RNA polymerase sigma-70 factor (ECF subfamily)
VSAADALEAVFRDERTRLLAALVALLRDFELAEEALQDALAAAAASWPRDGVPARPADWLVAVARNRAIDRLRRRRTAAAKLPELAAAATQAGPHAPAPAADDAAEEAPAGAEAGSGTE